MSMQWVRDLYDVPAKRGRYIEVYKMHRGKWLLLRSGKITSAPVYHGRPWLRAKGQFDHPPHRWVWRNGNIPMPARFTLDPIVDVVYYDEKGGKVLMDTRKPKPTE